MKKKEGKKREREREMAPLYKSGQPGTHSDLRKPAQRFTLILAHQAEEFRELLVVALGNEDSWYRYDGL